MRVTKYWCSTIFHRGMFEDSRNWSTSRNVTWGIQFCCTLCTWSPTMQRRTADEYSESPWFNQDLHKNTKIFILSLKDNKYISGTFCKIWALAPMQEWAAPPPRRQSHCRGFPRSSRPCVFCRCSSSWRSLPRSRSSPRSRTPPASCLPLRQKDKKNWRVQQVLVATFVNISSDLPTLTLVHPLAVSGHILVWVGSSSESVRIWW